MNITLLILLIRKIHIGGCDIHVYFTCETKNMAFPSVTAAYMRMYAGVCVCVCVCVCVEETVWLVSTREYV